MKTELSDSPGKKCKADVLKIKKDLPKNVRDLIYGSFPEYNTAKGYNLISNVLAGRTAHTKLTEILKQLALANKQNTQIEIPS
ncbi:MAG: hypothetical protein Q7W13_14120 [Bacteroidia bacterium]|nr:hypothetical protein [Bacteroidia bacterium]